MTAPIERGEPAEAGPSAAVLWLFRLGSAALFPVLALLLLEGALRLSGYGTPTTFTIPCELRGAPALCDNPDFTKPFFPPGLARTPTPFVLPREKGPRSFRVFLLGESAAQGDPEPAFGVGRFLQAMLEERFPGVGFEVVNTGIPAISSHVMRLIAREVAGLSPDLFILYAGNNEVVGPFGSGTVFTKALPGLRAVRLSIFLRGTRLGQLASALLRTVRGEKGEPREWKGLELFVENQVRADDPRMEPVYAAFEENLRDSLAAARGVPVLVSTMGTRLHTAPFASQHAPSLGAADLERIGKEYQAGVRLAASGKCDEALQRYAAVEAVDPGYAALHYRMALCLERQGDLAGARARLVRARDLDTLRFRADSRIDAAIRGAAAGQGVVLVDGAAALEEPLHSAAAPAASGRPLFWEHVHLTPEGNEQLARALFPKVVEAMPAALRGGGGIPPAPEGDSVYRRLGFTGYDRYRIAKEVLARLARPPFLDQLDHEAQVAAVALQREQGAAEPFEKSDERYRAALALAPNDPWVRLDYGILLDARDVFLSRRGGPDAGRAVEQYRKALEALPRLLAARFRLAEALLRLGRAAEAAAECRALLAIRPGTASAWRTLSQALRQEQKTGEAAAVLREGMQKDRAGAAELQEELGRLLFDLGRPAEAAIALQEAVAAGRSGGDLRLSLSRAQRQLGRRDEAKASAAAAEQAFRDQFEKDELAVPALLGIGNARVEQDDFAGATDAFAKAVKLQPLDPEARWSLGSALAALKRNAEAAALSREGAALLRGAGQLGPAEAFERRAVAFERGADTELRR